MPNRKRIFRLMRPHGILLQQSTGHREGRGHDSKVIVMRSDLRWCSDGFEFACWNGEIIRVALVIDAHDREVIADTAVAHCGISGSDVHDMMLEAIECRFGAIKAPHRVKALSDDGSPYSAKETRNFALSFGREPCFTPVASPESSGVAEAFVKAMKRDYVRVHSIPDDPTAHAPITGWLHNYNEHPREFCKVHQT